MADGANLQLSALDGAAAPGRYGRRTGAAGVIASEVRGAGLATITARNDRGAVVAEAARLAFAVELPRTPKVAEGKGIAFIWCGPDQWLAYRRTSPPEGMESLLVSLASDAAVVDQSHGRTILRVAGPRVRDALAKGVAVDLHPRVFKARDTAITLVSHIAVQLWQVDEQPTYEFAVARSLAQSFWHWLGSSAAEFGLDFVGP